MLANKRAQKGQAIVLVALMMAVLLGFAALAVDTGLDMADRRNLQAYADNAAMAGDYSLLASQTQAHYVAMTYLEGPLRFSLPLGGCSSSTTCPAGSYTTGFYTITISDVSSRQMDLTLYHSRPAGFSTVFGNTLHATSSSARAEVPGPVIVPALYNVVAANGNFQVNGGGVRRNPSGNVTGAVYSFGSFGANNVPHAISIPTVISDYNGNTCPGSPQNSISVGGVGNSGAYNWSGSGTGTTTYNVAVPTFGVSSAPIINGPTYTTAIQAKDGLGNWKPGIYSGFAPSNGALKGGVYKITNLTTSLNLTNLTQVTTVAVGAANTTGAVAFVIDPTVTSNSMSWAGSTLTGLDDLNGTPVQVPRDPMKTHNFLLYAPNLTGSMYIGSSNLAGLIYAPLIIGDSGGNASFTVTGSFWVKEFDLSGGGNGSQQFQWVCGLSAVAGLAGGGGLVR